MSLFTAYLIGVLPTLGNWLMAIGLAAGGILFFIVIISALADDVEYKKEDKTRLNSRLPWVKRHLWVPVTLCLVSSLIPSTKGMVAIAGIYIGANAAASLSAMNGVKELPQEVIDAARSWLKSAAPNAEKPLDM